MGEGVTNPAESAVDGPSVLGAACLKLVLLFGLSCAVILLLRRRHRKRKVETTDVAVERGEPAARLGVENPPASLTGPHLRRPVLRGTVSHLRPATSAMEQGTSVPSDQQPDSFFTWDTGGNSGEYSFVHTAVELPKYPDGSISEEERQMLLLYMQTGHPELLLNTTNVSLDGSHSLLGPPPSADAMLCDQATVRGFLETIVEENSDDLRSPSDCDEASVGWGSWDESDDDRLTVVEMETNDESQNRDSHDGINPERYDPGCVKDANISEIQKPVPASRYVSAESSKMQNTLHDGENYMGDWNQIEQQWATLSGATSVNNCSPGNCDAVYSNVIRDENAQLDKAFDERNVGKQSDDGHLMDTIPKVSLNSKVNADFESLWISANKMDTCTTESSNVWCKSETQYISPSSDTQNLNFNCEAGCESTNANSLLVLGTDHLCLVPSGVSESVAQHAEKLMFSDNFKDYFLPVENCVSPFNTDENSDNLKDVFVSENISANTKMRCFRIGFEQDNFEQLDEINCSVSDENIAAVAAKNFANDDLREETLFTPREGDIMYGSSWLNGSPMKKPEKFSSSSPPETPISTLSDSPPVDNIRKALHLSDQSASDDEIQPIPNSLSRWQHHTDLQHVQEATSPITRWQHQIDLHKNNNDENFSKQTDSEDDTDDGLPPQLRQIYSSFKMKDKKMARIRIKSDKNNKLELWDNQTKVTLPPFIANNEQNDHLNAIKKHLVKEEELDDLELELFSVDDRNSSCKSVPSSNADLEIDDALRSFNHLDDYSSNSGENSESENSYTVNTVENIDYDNEEFSEPSTPDVLLLQNNKFGPIVEEPMKSENENICSDNSDNCPLCTDPSFKHSKINDMFSNPSEERVIGNDVQSLLLNTFPKITKLVHEDTSAESKDSASPLTSSDSDEGTRSAKDVKKRVKRRLKDSSNAELKHDDSGYVEDDEDDDDDSLEEKDTKDPLQILPNVPKEASSKIRKSLSSAFYESKSTVDAVNHNELIPKSFEEFSNQLEQSVLAGDLKDGMITNEKWDIPENLSQFSAWLLDKELKKINCRDEMEKLIVNDIMSLREQAISQFLKNSSTKEKSANLEVGKATTSEIIGECVKDGKHRDESNTDSDKLSASDKAEQSSEELDSEYYNYNVNPNVSKLVSSDNQYILNSTSSKDTEQHGNVLCKSGVNSKRLEQNYDDVENDLSINKISEEDEIPPNRNSESIENPEKKSVLDIQTESSNDNETPEFFGECTRDASDTGIKSKVIYTTTEMISNEVPPIITNTENRTLAKEFVIDNKPVGKIALNVSLSAGDILNYDVLNNEDFENQLDDSIGTRINNNNEENSTDGDQQSKVNLVKIESSLSHIDSEDRLVSPNNDFNYERSAYMNKYCKTNDDNIQNEVNIIQLIDSSYLDSMVPPSTEIFENFKPLNPGNEIDLMISNAKGAYEGVSDDIIPPEAKVTSEKEESAGFVTDVDGRTYDELASVTRPVVNDGASTPLPTQGVVSGCLSVTAVSGSKQSRSEVASVSDLENSRSVDLQGELINEDILTVTTCPDKSEISEVTDTDVLIAQRRVNGGNFGLSNLYKSKSVTVLQTDDYSEEEDDGQILEESSNCVSGEDAKIYFSESVGELNSASPLGVSNIAKLRTQSSEDISTALPNKDQHEEFTRSRSVDRGSHLESWTGQSWKSTPDLSGCHDRRLSSSIPLSALLSKSVSQRIQDYLGKSSRGSRSLPPNERSRHYRRICVSTETVVERAARFEARSKSSGREISRDSGNYSWYPRSGSCPPPNMRNGDALQSVRNYSKPTATVRPTIDVYRSENGIEMGKKSQEDLLELITGYNQATKIAHKPPPVPQATPVHQIAKSFRLKGKIASARREFFERLNHQDLAKTKAGKGTSPADVDHEDATTCGMRRFSEFRKSAREERARMAQSHPDLGALEAAVRSSRRRIDQLKKRRQKETPPLDAGQQPGPDGSTMPASTKATKDGTLVLPYRRCTGEIAWASCSKRLQEERSRPAAGSRTREPLEIIDVFKRPAERPPMRAHEYGYRADDQYENDEYSPASSSIPGSDFSRARSMDFLLDNREGAEPPENRLAQRVKSEHELRIERSLQNLNLPEWYTQTKKPKEGFILRRGSEGSAGESRKRWLGFSSSRTPSATSLTTPPSAYSQRSIVIPKRVTPTSGEWRCIGSLVSSRESLLTPASPASLSPRECSSAAFSYGLNTSLSRWSSSRLSTSSAPLTALSVHRSFRQPYLGWRAAASSSGGVSPGISPINATTPLQGSRPSSPRRGSQEHQHGYGLQQNQVTSASTLRPESNETADSSGSRISPLALYDNATNVFFSTNVEVPPNSYSTPELRRDRYSYTQSLYSGTVIVSPCAEFKPVPSIAEDTTSFAATDDSRFSMSKSPQPPPRIWMESSFVGSKKDGQDAVQYPQGRTIRIVPSDSVRSGDSSKPSTRSTCAPQTAMGEYVLRDFRRFGITL